MADLRSRAAAANAPQGSQAYENYQPNPSGSTGESNELPDVADSGIPAEMDVPVGVAWSRVMGDVQWVDKNRTTTSGARYAYRGIDDVKNAVAPVLRKHGVIVMPTKVTASYEIVKVSSGSSMNFCRATVTWAVVGPKGDLFPVQGETVGEAFDSGDKAATKAQSVAERIFYVVALCIPTNQPQLDPEYSNHELAAPKAPTAAEYYRMILEDGVSLIRLGQIKSELIEQRSIGEAVIEEVDGSKARLIDIVQREGVKAKARELG